MPRGCPASDDDRFQADGAALSPESARTGAQSCLQVSTQQIELCDSLATDCTSSEQVANWFTGCPARVRRPKRLGQLERRRISILLQVHSSTRESHSLRH